KINEIKNSRRQLVAREAKLNSIFNAAVEGIITINEKGIIESANSAATKIFNYHANELIGKHVNKLMPSPHNEIYGDFLQYYLPSHQAKIIGEIQQLDGRRKDGSLVPLDLSISKYKIDDKPFFTGMIRDVSERKRKELLDKQHLDELAHVTRMGLMGEMASGIAHEVNQPLAAIATYCQVSLSMLNTDKPDLLSLQEVLQKTEKQALRAGQIISRMRAFITSNTLQRSTIDINELVDDAMDLARDECQKFSIKCSMELADALPSISADRVQIEQVLLNLIKNSIDAVSKLPKDKQRKLSVQTYLREDRKIEIRVKDNGLGINEVEQGKIFTPFFTTKESGMGMGLSICQSLINAHGGELRFSSEKNKGSTFYFTLPIIGKSNED
ncbi:MAG: PAS domain S-box protein, partial [Methylococcales bacterium]|nr:PAS domain S-box protein [Methylococcales bacterium]